MTAKLRNDLTLSLLLTTMEAAEGRYKSFLATIPRDPRHRTPDQQREADVLLDVLHKASREWREAEGKAFWEMHDAGAEEVRKEFPWLRSVK